MYLRVLRSAKNFSQFGIGNELGIRQSTYSRIENNPETMTLKQLTILSDLYKIKPSALLDFADDDLSGINELLSRAEKTA